MKYKYPRTFHLPWSLGATSDDKILKSIEQFFGKYVVMTQKMDGENTTISRDYYHARSLDSVDHPSRHWLKGMWGNMSYEIPEGWRICGENLYAEHSIRYDNLESYFQVFSIWNENNKCLSWDDTVEWCKLLGLCHVPVIWKGIFDEQFLRNYTFDTEKQEGYVIRIVDEFDYNDFSKSVAKFVRPSHVTTDEHWMNKKIIPNELKINK